MSAFDAEHASPSGGGRPEPGGPGLRRAFLAAIACFAVAAAAGSLLRFGVLHGFPWGLTYLDVRHAHTHLMYFGWVTPALFALIGVAIARRGERRLPRAYPATIVAALAAGLLAFVPFLLSGYRPLAIGGARLPLSMIASALAVLSWYAWGAAYLSATWRMRRDLATFALDAALLVLLVSSTGAWGLALAALSPVASGSLMDALVHFYLDTFSHGWFALALVGLLLADLPRPPDRPGLRVALAAWLVGLLAAAFADLVGAPQAVAFAARLLAAGGLLALALALGVAAGRAARGTHAVLGGLLGAKALLDAVLTFPEAAAWSQRMLLQVFWVHAFLLGFATIALAALALRAWRPRATWTLLPLAGAVFVLLGSLLPLTLVYPAAWRGPWVLPFAAWATVPPTVALLALGAALVRPRRRPPR